MLCVFLEQISTDKQIQRLQEQKRSILHQNSVLQSSINDMVQEYQENVKLLQSLISGLNTKIKCKS